MSTAQVIVTPWPLARLGIETFPAVIATAGEHARQRFLGFFTTHIRNRNTDMAYARAIVRFLAWCDTQGWQLEHIEARGVATYLEHLQGHASSSTVRQHLAIIRQLFDWLVVGQVLSLNPARTVRGPASVGPGKISVRRATPAEVLLDSMAIDTGREEQGGTIF